MSKSVDSSMFDQVFYANVRKQIVTLSLSFFLGLIIMSGLYFFCLKYLPGDSFLWHIGFGLYIILFIIFVPLVIRNKLKISGKVTVGLNKDGVYVFPDCFVNWMDVKKMEILKGNRDNGPRVQITFNKMTTNGPTEKNTFIYGSSIDMDLRKFIEVLKDYQAKRS